MEETLKLIREAILNIAKQHNIKIDKIILFGSRARGDYKEDSDWDILIVTEDKLNREKEQDFAIKITSELHNFIDQDVELIVVDKRTFEEYKTPAYLYYYAEKEGKLLWYSKIQEDVEYLLKRALGELKVIELEEECIYPFCPLAVRDLLKAFLFFNGEFEIPNDIVELVKLCIQIDKEFKERFQEFIDVFERLEAYDSFNNTAIFDKNEDKRVIEVIEKVKYFVLGKLKAKPL